MSVDAAFTLGLLKKLLPTELHDNVLLVGSLAAAYHHRAQLGASVRTKDADLMIQPAGALESCRDVALRLLADGWQHRVFKKYRPGGQDTPIAELPVIRLHPEGVDKYFVELLALPQAEQREAVQWHRVELDDGFYGVPTFRFMGLFARLQLRSEHGPTPSSSALPRAGEFSLARPVTA